MVSQVYHYHSETTNAEYRQARGLDHPFTATEEQVKQAWFAMNHEEIEAASKRKADARKAGNYKARATFNHEFDPENE